MLNPLSWYLQKASTQSAFACNQDAILSRDETLTGKKKILFTREFRPRMKRVEFHPGIKFNLTQNLPFSPWDRTQILE